MADRITALYVRLSVALDRDEATGELDYRNLTVQEADLRREATRRGWSNVRVYTEHGISAGKASEAKRRIFYGELVRDIEAGAIDRVLFWAVDRASRYTTALMQFADLCEEHNVTVVVPAQGIHLEPGDDRLVFVMHGGIGESESRTRSRRAKAYRKRKRDENGQHRIGGRVPFGYVKNPVTKKVTVDRRGAKAVRDGATMLLNGGSLYAVAREWERRGIRSSTGKLVSPQTIKKAMRSTDLLDADVQRVVVARLWNQGDRRARGLNTRTYILSGGYIRCGECGEKLLSQRRGSHDPTKQWRAYNCVPHAVANGVNGCGQVRVRADEAESHVLTALRDVIAYRDGVATPPSDEEAAGLEAERAAVESRLDELAGRLAEGVSADLIVRAEVQLREQLKEVEERITATARRSVSQRWAGLPDRDYSDLSDRTVFDQWRAAVEENIEYVAAWPGRYEITWRPEAAELVAQVEADWEAAAAEMGVRRRKRPA